MGFQWRFILSMTVLTIATNHSAFGLKCYVCTPSTNLKSQIKNEAATWIEVMKAMFTKFDSLKKCDDFDEDSKPAPTEFKVGCPSGPLPSACVSGLKEMVNSDGEIEEMEFRTCGFLAEGEKVACTTNKNGVRICKCDKELCNHSSILRGFSGVQLVFAALMVKKIFH